MTMITNSSSVPYAEIVLCFQWLSALVNPQKCNIQIESWEHEVVRVPAKKCYLCLWSKYKPNIIVSPIPIKMKFWGIL
jgi:hypothetical protein